MAAQNKTNALRLAESAGLKFEAFEYDTSDGRIDGCSVAEKLGRSADEVFKTLVAQSPAKEYFVFVVPSAGELELKKAARAAGVKSIALIPLKDLLPLTGYVHGGCSPLGMKKQFPLFIDETAQLFDRIWVSGGRVGLNIAVEPVALAELLGGKFCDLGK